MTNPTSSSIRVKRVYEPPSKSDGQRVLVDRLWPRGLSKEAANVHVWLKEVAPTSTLRKWFGHAPDRWPEFQRRYQRELETNAEPLAQLIDLSRERRVTLVFGAKDEERNQAVVLQRVLAKMLSRV